MSQHGRGKMPATLVVSRRGQITLPRRNPQTTRDQGRRCRDSRGSRRRDRPQAGGWFSRSRATTTSRSRSGMRTTVSKMTSAGACWTPWPGGSETVSRRQRALYRRTQPERQGGVDDRARQGGALDARDEPLRVGGSPPQPGTEVSSVSRGFEFAVARHPVRRAPSWSPVSRRPSPRRTAQFSRLRWPVEQPTC